MQFILGLVACAASGALNALGGKHWLFCRRYIMPVVIGVFVSVVSGTWWLGLLVLPVMGTLCLGYFPWGAFGRAAWLGLQAIVIGAGALITGHLAWYFYIPYVALSFVLGGTLFNLNQVIGDSIFGAGLASCIFFIH